MRQTAEQMQATFEALMDENGFQPTGEATFEGKSIYAREWKKTENVCWHGEHESTYRIETHESKGHPIFFIYLNGRRIDCRDYSSPKRGINAIREVVRFAGYEF